MIAALYVRRDSIYKTIPGVECWDVDRDARNYPGGMPVIAHPPCRGWGRMRQFSHHTPEEKSLGILAVEQVRQNGGVLEHPEQSTLWSAAALPSPGRIDAHGGFTLVLDQCQFGHPARKRTWLYIVGLTPSTVPNFPIYLGEPDSVVRPAKNGRGARIISKKWREATPPAFAEWLVDLASTCERPPHRGIFFVDTCQII